MTMDRLVINKVIRKVLKGQDYRGEVLALINAQFLDHVINFFKKLVEAKISHTRIDVDWYTANFLSESLPSIEIINNSGLNQKTIRNEIGSTSRSVVLDISRKHHAALIQLIDALAQKSDLDLQLGIKFRGLSVDLNLSESVVVINALAVTRATLRGGAWSSVGKRVELPLMQTLCQLLIIPAAAYRSKEAISDKREIDFYFINADGKDIHCEVKLMGKGNPESADAAFARSTNILIADTLSLKTKAHLAKQDIHWVELRSETGFRKLSLILTALSVPHTPFEGDLDAALDAVLTE